MDNTYTLRIDTPSVGVLTLRLVDGHGTLIDEVECAYSGHVDNLLLTAVDNLITRSSIDRFALRAVELGTGIDKNSSLYRIVQSFAAAIRACLPAGRAAR